MRLASVYVVTTLALALTTPSYGDGATGPQAGNVIKNSSFEVGSDGYGVLRGEYVKTGQRPVSYYAPTLDTQQKTHGLASLRIDNPDAGTWRFFSKGFPVEPGQSYILSFAARAAHAGEQIVVNLDYADGAYDEVGAPFTLSQSWKRYSLNPITIKPGHHLGSIQITYAIYGAPRPGSTIWLDALQVKAETSKYGPRSLELGILNGLPRPYTKVASQDFPVSFKIRNNTAASASTTLQYSVEDEYFKKVVSQGEIKVATASNSTLTKTLRNISPRKRGKYILKADLVNAAKQVVDHSEFDFAVIDSVKKKPGQFTDAFSISDTVQQRGQRPMALEQSGNVWSLYGSSLDEMFDFRAEAGDRWIRSWDFGWGNVEVADNEWDWRFTDLLVANAKARGIRIMPVLMDVPGWVQKENKGKTEPTVGGGKIFMPSMQAWERYVKACVKRYKGTINTWEIQNEPNLWITPDQYLVYLRSSYRAIKAADPSSRVVAFSASQDYGGNTEAYLEEVFKKGALNFCDVVSIHPYGARLDWTKPVSAEALNLRLRKLMNQYGGAKKGLWVGELFYVGKNAGDNDPYAQRLLQGHEYARRYFIDLSTGMGRSFTIPDTYYFKLFNPQSWAVNTHLTGGMIPGTAFVINNTITRIFEGAKPRGQIKLTGKNKLYLYSRGKIPLAVAWSFDDQNKPSLLTIPNSTGKIRVLDIMGNPSDAVKVQGQDLLLTLTNSPLYLLPEKNAASQLRPLLSGSRATGGELLSLGAGFALKNDRPAVAVQVTNLQAQPLSVALGVSVPNGEFALQAPTSPISLPAGGVKTLLVPVESAKAWQTARVNIRATVGSQSVEKEVPINSHPVLDCPALKVPVQLNGRVEATEWQDANQFHIDRAAQINDGKVEEWQGSQDSSATGFVKYDAQALYLGLQVKDQMRGHSPAGSPIYDTDAVELFLDGFPLQNLGEDFFQNSTAQLLFGLPNQQSPQLRQSLSPPSGKSFDLSQIQSATQDRPDGYDLEIRIPWKQFTGFVASRGTQIGFDLSLDDADEGPHRKMQMVWAGHGKNYEDRTLFGRLILR